MATRKIKNAKDLVTDELIYFKSHAQATFMSDGTTVEDKINGLQNGGGNLDLSKYVQKTELSSVATSGNYNDLSNKPTIPSAVTESTVSGWGFTKNAGTVTGVKINGTTKSPSSGVVDLGIVITAHQTLKTINGQSIIGSGDITISGGSSSGSCAYPQINHDNSDPLVTITPNTFHVWDEIGTLDVSLGAETTGVANEYLFQFTSGSEPTSLILPDDIKWANDEAPVIEANKIYQISILKGLGSVLSFNNVSLIAFYVDDIEYKAEAGMTWYDWMGSEYNTAGFYTDGMGTIFLGDGYIASDSHGDVYPEEEIREGCTYILFSELI